MRTFQQQARVTINVERAFFARLKNDPINLNPAAPDAVAPTYDEPVHLPDLRHVNVSSNDQNMVVFGDGRARLNAQSKGEKTVNTARNSFNNKEKRYVLGHEIDEDGVTLEGSTSIAPQGAFGFVREYMTEDGMEKEYVWHFKGTFAMPSQNAAQREGQPSPQFMEVVGTFLERGADGWTTAQVTTTDQNEIADLDNTWFTLATLQKLRVSAAEDFSGATGPGGGSGGSGSSSVSAQEFTPTAATKKAAADAIAAKEAADKAAEEAERAAKISIAAVEAAKAEATAKDAAAKLKELQG